MISRNYRLIPIFLVLVLCFLSGCRQGSEPQESFSFSILYNQNQSRPYQPDWLILSEYQERKNVTLDVRVGDDSDYQKSIDQIFETGEVPDVILKVYPNSIDEYAASGRLLPISDYLELMPYFRQYVSDHQLERELEKLKLENGKYYILPGYQRKIQVQQWIYRKDLFEKHEIKTPQTYQDILSSLKTLKEFYPESTPITATWGGAHLWAMMGAGYDIPAGWAGTRNYNQNQDRWEYAPATENYRELHEYLAECYQSGILDPAIFTQTDEEFYQKLTDGRGIVTVTWITSGFNSWNELLAENGIPDGEWAPLPVPISTIGLRALPAVDPYRKGIAISSEASEKPYFEDLLRFLDWAIYSEEGMTLTYWGVEGITYQETDDGKEFLPEIATPKNPDGSKDPTAEYGLATLFDLNENREFEDYKKPPEIVEFLDRSLADNETLEMDPVLKLDSNALDAISDIQESLNEYVAATSQRFIMGELDIDEDWETYLLELDKRGYKSLEVIWNTAWQGQY
jgi:putative aldouronate transport system substrate-binding protein